MKTSHLQQLMLVEFMEKHGDLSKPSGGARGRQYIQTKWKELADLLNNDGTGDSRSEEKWRKVWSDMKNNTKKKSAKIHKAASGTGGGPALTTVLTDFEHRIMQIIGIQAALGMAIEEAGFEQDDQDLNSAPHAQPAEQEDLLPDAHLFVVPEEVTEGWHIPGTSSQATVAPPEDPSSDVFIPIEEPWKPPAPKKRKTDNLAKLFVESDAKAREYTRERDTMYERLETERLRIQEYEIRERTRQRDEELRLQARWLEFMRETLDVIKRYFERENM